MPTLIVDGREITVSIRPKGGGDGTLYIDFYCPNGKRCRWSTGTADEPKAHAAYRTMIRDIEAEVRQALKEAIPERQENPRIAEITDYYTRVYLPNKHSAPKTITKSLQVLREWELWCAENRVGRLQQLGRQAIDAHAAELRERKQSAKSIAVRLGIIRACLNAAVEADLCGAHPIKKWLMPTVDEPEIQPLTPEELALVLSTVLERRPDLYNIVAWIAWTGNRPSDAIDIRWNQVDTGARVVTRAQVKTSRLASYEISEAAAALIATERARVHGKPPRDGIVFTTRHHEPFTVNKLYHDFTRAIAGVEGIPPGTNLKTLRHTFGHIMVNVVRCPLPTVQVLMGHRDITTTIKYVRPCAAHEFVNQLSALSAPTKRPTMPQDDPQGPTTPPKPPKPRAGQKRPLPRPNKARKAPKKTTE